MPHRIEFLAKLGMEIPLIFINLGMFLFVNLSEAMTIIDKGGVLAILLIVSYILWKIVKKQAETIKKISQERIKDKDKQIEELKKIIENN